MSKDLYKVLCKKCKKYVPAKQATYRGYNQYQCKYKCGETKEKKK